MDTESFVGILEGLCISMDFWKFRTVTIEPGKNAKREEMEYVSKFERSQCWTHEE